ncbi:predicted protein [Naegleria gruberi]|uniref:Predicted protein n=1 Tax=Naegleria gruberi TaxID=5762 RepID=D2VP80_NAEGR|nr:uncharacterized protein NAEGRDRAFT_70761 [Naegleria gruberi]EFC41313.1 predicted protein [Naegleria gruberi]|eukprot:XP_002674057.1 predicted protein [Naegleria gruberi strain NEG-M]
MITDLYFKSSFPCSAFYLFARGYSTAKASLINEEKGIFELPLLDFSVETGHSDPSFRVYPWIPLDQIDANVNDLQCRVVVLNEEYTYVYPRDTAEMLKLFERFCANIEETSYSIMINNMLERYIGLDNYLDTLQRHTVCHHEHFRRVKCVNPTKSARIYFQSQVDKYSKQIFEKFKGVNEELACVYLSKFPFSNEVEYLLNTHIGELLENIPEDFSTFFPSFTAQRTKLKESYRGTFGVDGFLIRAIDKCLRRYLHLFVLSEPTLTLATKSGSFSSSKLLNCFEN